MGAVLPIQSRFRLAGAFLLAAGALIGCDLNHEQRTVDGRRFAVTKANLITPNIPWLPASQRDGLMFLLNPSDRPQKQVIVLLEDHDQACVGRNASAYMRSLCDQIGNGRFERIERESSLLTLPAPSDNIGVFYVRRDNPKVFVAQCIPSVSPGVDGMCHSVGTYRNTHFTIRLPEQSIRDLPKLVAQTDQFLQSWEIDDKRAE